jgi:hypothetical protein
MFCVLGDLGSTTARSGATLEASAVLLLVSDGPAGGTSILVASADAPSFVVLGGDTEEGFARLRGGAIVYGMPETYQALPRDMVRGHERVLEIWPDRFRSAHMDRSGSLFGASPDDLLVPVREDGTPFDRIRVPIPSLGRPAYLEFAREAAPRDALFYRLVGEARAGEGYICPYCGKLCEQKEPHTAAHGVAGHANTGALAGQAEAAPHPALPGEPEGRGARV